MEQFWSAKNRRRGVTLVVVVLSAALLAGCGDGVERLEVGAPDPIAAPRPAEPTSLTSATTFQGAVAAVDRATGTVVVAVQIVWVPVLEARAHERRVQVDSQTVWEPGPGDISRLVVGEEVQVEAADAPDGVSRAVKILLMDID